MAGLRIDLKQLVRRRLRQPGTTLLLVAVLALGIGATTAIVAVVDTVLVAEAPFAEPDRLLRITSQRGGDPGLVSMRDVEDLERLDVFSGVAAYIPGSQYTLQGKAGPEKPPAVLMTHDLFRVLGVAPLHGTTVPTSYDRERSFGILLGHRLWQRQFGGDPAIVGSTISLDASPDFTPSYTVYGVLPPGFDFPGRADLYRSIYINAYYPNLEDRGARNVTAVARLAPGVPVADARRAVEALAQRLSREEPASSEGVELVVEELRETWVGPLRPYVLLLLAAAVLLLGVAVFNTANVLVAESQLRATESAVRLALGGTRPRVLRPLLLEGCLIALLGAVAGLAVAAVLLRVLERTVRLDLPAWIEPGLEPRVVAVAVGIALLAGAAAAVPAALRTASLATTLAGGSRTVAGGGLRLRRLLVGSEVALAAVLLVGAGLLAGSFGRLVGNETGLGGTDRLLTFQVGLPWTYGAERSMDFQRRLLERLRELPGTRAASANANLPLTLQPRREQTEVRARDQSELERRDNPWVNVQRVSPGWFRTAGIPVLAGRSLGEQDREGAPLATVVSRRLAERLWPGREPVGQQLRGPRLDPSEEPPWLTVVGVAGDVRFGDLGGEAGYDLYLSLWQFRNGWTYFAVRTEGDPDRLAAEVPRIVAAVDPTQPVFDVQVMDERARDTVWRQELAAVLFSIFSLSALALATAGVYGAMVYLVVQRRRELGVRLALGASPAQVRRLVLGEGLALTAVGTVAGLAAASLVARGLGSLLYGVEPVHPPTLLSVALGLGAVAVMATAWPARQAGRIDPVESLRPGP